MGPTQRRRWRTGRLRGISSDQPATPASMIVGEPVGLLQVLGGQQLRRRDVLGGLIHEYEWAA
jgi:hypothetical protein